MRLAEFIETQREKILVEWDDFARTCTPAAGAMNFEALRDHAGEMLTVFAADLKTPQNPAEQAEKSKGNAPEEPGMTAAEEHGAGRAESGFTVEQMVAEYRALRASVIRLWTKEQGELGPTDISDLTRFNEAIDQALAESVTRYSKDLDNSKEMFLAILGHDLRTPIGAILTSARFMVETEELKEPHLTLAKRIASSGTRMNHMVGDLLDFTRSRLGGGITIKRAEMNMGKVVHDVVDELLVSHPGKTIEIDTRDVEHSGEWDAMRISQALTNLIGNALEHGSAGAPVRVEIQGDDDELVIAIHNRGDAIPSDRLNGIFNPMKTREATARVGAAGTHGNLGLGLYIAERIVTAHGGRIEVTSSDADGTTFTLHLPRKFRVDERRSTD